MMYYDFHGSEITFEEWSKLYENTDARRVGSTWMGSSQYWISTVWIGINYAFKGAPLIYETMIFNGDKDIYMERHTNWDAAEEGHLRAIQWLLDKLGKNSIVRDSYLYQNHTSNSSQFTTFDKYPAWTTNSSLDNEY